MEYELLYGKRQNKEKEPQLLYIQNENCLFIKNNERYGKKEFQCYQRVLSSKKKKNVSECQPVCNARAILSCDGILRRNETNHSGHDDHLRIVNDLRTANKIKDVCSAAGKDLPTHKVSTKQIFYHEIARCGFETSLEYSKMKRQLFRIKNSKYPKLPKCIEDIRTALEQNEVMKDFGYTLDKSNVLYVGTVVKKSYSFVIFASRKVIDIIKNMIPSTQRRLLIDGTFQIVPRQFNQLIVISIEYKNDIFPIFYALTTRKTAESYRQLLKYIETVFQLDPKEIITDFEEGLRKAVNDVYPKATLRGCWFHYCKSIRAKSNELGMAILLRTNPNAKLFQKQLMNLPLLPPNEIVNGFKGIKLAINASQFKNPFKDLLHYYESYWLKQNSRNSLSVAELNMRTTSSLESLNSQMRRTFPTHGHIWQFIEQLKFHEYSKASDMSSIMGKPHDHPKTKKAQERHNKILLQTNLLKIGKISVSEFLIAVSV